MKKYIIISVCTVLLFSACTSSFIDHAPISTATQDLYYKSDKDFQDALTGVYASVRTQYRDMYLFGDVRADDSWIQQAKNNNATYSDQFTSQSNDGGCSTAWSNYYQAIFRANLLLEKIEDVDIPRKARYIAETRFLRAVCYFDLVRIFGDVPPVTSVLSVKECYSLARAPVSTIYNEIILPDLLAAESGLPATYASADVGRPTLGAAKALLGRVYLTLGNFQQAESKLMEVTTMGYDLEPDYESIFYNANKRHKGYIWDIEYESGVGCGSNKVNNFMPNDANMAAYFNVRGTGNEWNNPTQQLIDLYEPGDIRKLISVGERSGFTDRNGNWVPIQGGTCQTYTKKYLVNGSPAAGDDAANWKYIRFADVLLMLAEAMNENGKTAQAIPHLNRVRARAKVSEYPLTMNQAETRAAIEKERRLELCFEGHRWFDLLRTGKAYETMKSFGMEPHMTVFPIPLAQLQLVNDPAVLWQNPGYR